MFLLGFRGFRFVLATVFALSATVGLAFSTYASAELPRILHGYQVFIFENHKAE